MVWIIWLCVAVFNETGIILHTSHDYPDENSFKIYPNPFSQQITLEYTLASSEKAVINLYKLNGQMVKTIASGIMSPGLHQMRIDGTNLLPGIYIILLQSGNHFVSRKLIKIN